MPKRDYYEILGVAREAPDGEIKTAYRKLALKYHPDRNPNDKTAEDKFKEATEAYEILKDPQKRQTYDQFGHAGVSGQGMGGFGGGFGGFDISDALRAFMRDFGGFGFDFDDMFGGGGGRRERRSRGEDLRVRIELSLEEIATGVEKKVKVKKLVPCPECEGSGAAPGHGSKTCPDCKGRGQIRTLTRSLFGTIQQVRTCPTCRGTGEVISRPCTNCQGQGRVRDSETVKVEVPPGVSAGNYMNLQGKGNVGPNKGQPGDLVVLFDEKEHDQFARQGDNIICEIPISFTLAALGGETTVPTLNGDHSLKIPSGTQSGKVFKLRGKGIPHLHSHGSGDELIRVTVWTPTELSSEDKMLLKELNSSESFKPPKGDKSFLAKLRESLGL